MERSFGFAHVFSDNMVLQRDAALPVWGWADKGDRVRVEFCGQVREAAVVDGQWRVDFSPLAAGGPYTLTASCGGRQIALGNILMGEVWLAGGQSNMDYTLLLTRDGYEEIPLADYPGIRHYAAPRIAFEQQPGMLRADPEQPAWAVCTPQAAPGFTAVGYHFAKNLHRALGVPVGIINCNWGGTSASCWMSRERLQRGGDIRVYLDEYLQLVSGQSPQAYAAEEAAYAAAVAVQQQAMAGVPFDPTDLDAYFASEAEHPYPWPPPMGLQCPLRPAGLYDTMLRKIVPYAIRGVIWYQGESDTVKAPLYRSLFTQMMDNWREDWQAPRLPFLFVQLAAYAADNDPDGESWALLREQQLLVSQTDGSAAMAVAIDCGNRTNIHPLDKGPVGERLALLARTQVYGDSVECFGPRPVAMRAQGGSVVLTFEHAGQGLAAKGGELRGFALCGCDGIYHPAQGEIDGNTVTVRSEAVPQPLAVRYGWANYTEANLYNSAGLPASPFRTDTPYDELKLDRA